MSDSLLGGLGLGGLLGQTAGSIANTAPQSSLQAQNAIWTTTTTNTNTIPSMTGQQAYQGRSYELLEENQKLLREVKDDLLPLKKWLIQTYPDIYKQYVALEELKEASK